MPSLDRLEADLQRDVAALQRDAFIVSQLVVAAGDLKDYQKYTAMERSLERINIALRRATDSKPPAPPSTQDLLRDLQQSLQHARQQGATANLEDIQKEVLKRSGEMQSELFRELDAARKQRQMVTDAQARLAKLAALVDTGISDALSSTFDYFRAGGR
jgi:hypothetical protein